VHFNYLGSDVLLSTIYRALETNAKVYKLSGCAETFSLNYLILYLVNNWFVSFNWHYLYLIILHSLQYWHSITQLPSHCGGCLASWKVSVAQPVWHNSLRYIKLQSITRVCSQGVLVFKWITLVTSVSQGDLWFSYNFHIDIIYLVVAIYKFGNRWTFESTKLVVFI
jgi:hypothetical protein